MCLVKVVRQDLVFPTTTLDQSLPANSHTHTHTQSLKGGPGQETSVTDTENALWRMPTWHLLLAWHTHADQSCATNSASMLLSLKQAVKHFGSVWPGNERAFCTRCAAFFNFFSFFTLTHSHSLFLIFSTYFEAALNSTADQLSGQAGRQTGHLSWEKARASLEVLHNLSCCRKSSSRQRCFRPVLLS